MADDLPPHITKEQLLAFRDLAREFNGVVGFRENPGDRLHTGVVVRLTPTADTGMIAIEIFAPDTGADPIRIFVAPAEWQRALDSLG